MNSTEIETQIDALKAGRAFVELADWWKIAVAGPEARGWLNDLLSADITAVGAGRSVRSLLLTPTGRIRADVTVIAWEDAFLLVQDSRQPSRIDEMLGPYVLSADVRLEDRTAGVYLAAIPEGDLDATKVTVSRPSCIGPGTDVLAGSADLLSSALEAHVPAAPEALEVWRIIRGMPRFPVDLTERSLPQEAALDDVIEYGKGCFLGQEAMAKIKRGGHPTQVVLAAHAERPVQAGEAVISEGDSVGVVTSAATVKGSCEAIVRVRWPSRAARLSTGSGVALRPAGIPVGSEEPV